jgi:hypothetical protein
MTAPRERGGFGFAVVVMVMLVLLTGVLLTAMRKAEGQEQSRADWFESLRQPKTGYSCCDISDCRRAQGAEWRDGQWWAKWGDQWSPVPQEKVLMDKHSIDGDPYICAGNLTRQIYCFVRPNMGF